MVPKPLEGVLWDLAESVVREIQKGQISSVRKASRLNFRNFVVAQTEMRQPRILSKMHK